MKQCFHTIGYKGAFIHLCTRDGFTHLKIEEIAIQLADGTRHICKTLLGAKRLITKLSA